MRLPVWSFSLRQILFLGTALGIILPALGFGAFQVNNRFDKEVSLRVKLPTEQYADMLSRGMGLALWNLDRGIRWRIGAGGVTQSRCDWGVDC